MLMINIPIVEDYLGELTTIILDFGASATFIKAANDNVRMQIYSFMSHWKDDAFRNALFILGKEEGDYYQPFSHINPFVVVAIRNSMLETLHSVAFEEAGLTNPISNEEMQRLTRHAIQHFASVDFEMLCSTATIEEKQDYYGQSAAKYPLAWTALCQLGCSKRKILTYPAAVQDGEEAIQYNGEASVNGQVQEIKKTTQMVIDGYTKTIEPDLQNLLDNIRAKKLDCVFFDGFKRLTRNTEKLLYIMNYVLYHEGEFVTTNYYITNGYIEQRPVIMKPTHNTKEFFDLSRQYKVLSGNLGKKHLATLRNVFSQ